ALGVGITGELVNAALPIGAVELGQPTSAIVEEQRRVVISCYERAGDDVSPARRVVVTGEVGNVALTIHVVELGQPAIFIIEEQGRVILVHFGCIGGNDVRPAFPPAIIAIELADAALAIRSVELAMSRVTIVKK